LIRVIVPRAKGEFNSKGTTWVARRSKGASTSEQLVSGRNGVKLGAYGAGLNVMSNSQNNIVMTDENKIIGDAFAIFV
jgi:hypothetical protein